MRSIPAALKTKLLNRFKAESTDSEPRIRMIAKQTSFNTLLTEPIHKDIAPSYGDVTVRQLAGESEPSLAYAICLDLGIASIYSRQFPSDAYNIQYSQIAYASVSMQSDTTNLRLNFNAERLNYNSSYNDHMFSSVGIPSVAMWKLPNPDIFPHIPLKNIPVGNGDGETTDFDLPIPLFVEDSESIRVNGVTMERGVDYTIKHDNNNLCYGELFPCANRAHVTTVAGHAYTSTSYSRPMMVAGRNASEAGLYFPNSSSSKTDPMAYTEYDFGSVQPFNRIRFAASCMRVSYSWSALSVNVVLQYSADGTTWKTAFDQTVGPDTAEIIVKLDPVVNARYWRGFTTGSYYGYATKWPNLGKFDDLGKTENILQGLVYCADCGRPLVRYKSVSHGKKMWYTFICPMHSTDKNACPLKSIREDELLSVLQEAITKQIALAVDMQALTATVNSSPANKKHSVSKQSLLEQERKALKRCEELRDSLYQNYVEKLMTEREYMTMKERYTSETEAHADRIKELERQIEAAKVYTPENRFLASFSFFKGASTLSRDLLVALIDRIEVGEGNRVNIKFRFQDEFLILNDYLRKEATPDEYGSKVSPHIQ